MINYKKISDKIYKILRGFDFDVKMYDIDGNATHDASLARNFYVFDPNIMVVVDENKEEVRFNKSENWSWLKTKKIVNRIKFVTNEYMLRFSLRNFGKTFTPRDFAHETMLESCDIFKESKLGPMTGTKKTSRQKLESVIIRIKHKKPVNEKTMGARSRNISAIFLEYNGERQKYPYNHLSGARAMARHLVNGGSLIDEVGTYIVESSYDFIKLRNFLSYTKRNNLINETTDEIITTVRENIQLIQRDLKRLSGTKTYNLIKERIINSKKEQLESNDLNSIKDMFTVKILDQKVQDVLPVVNRLVQEKKNLLRKVEEALEQDYSVSPIFTSTKLLTFENENQKLAFKIKQVAEGTSNEYIKNFLYNLGNKINSGKKANTFETKVFNAVLEKARVKKEIKDRIDENVEFYNNALHELIPTYVEVKKTKEYMLEDIRKEIELYESCLFLIEENDVQEKQQIVYVWKVIEAAKRGLSLVHRLPKEQRRPHFSRIFTILNIAKSQVAKLMKQYDVEDVSDIQYKMQESFDLSTVKPGIETFQSFEAWKAAAIAAGYKVIDRSGGGDAENGPSEADFENLFDAETEDGSLVGSWQDFAGDNVEGILASNPEIFAQHTHQDIEPFDSKDFGYVPESILYETLDIKCPSCNRDGDNVQMAPENSFYCNMCEVVYDENKQVHMTGKEAYEWAKGFDDFAAPNDFKVVQNMRKKAGIDNTDDIDIFG